MDLLFGVGIFIPPEARHLVGARIHAIATAQHNVERGFAAGSTLTPEPYSSPTMEYMTRLKDMVDPETWKLVQVILKRYYSNLLDILIQREAKAQLEHILRDYPDLMRDCGTLLL